MDYDKHAFYHVHKLSTPPFLLFLFSFICYKTRSWEILPHACALCNVISLRRSSVLIGSKLTVLKKEQYKTAAKI